MAYSVEDVDIGGVGVLPLFLKLHHALVNDEAAVARLGLPPICDAFKLRGVHAEKQLLGGSQGRIYLRCNSDGVAGLRSVVLGVYFELTHSFNYNLITLLSTNIDFYLIFKNSKWYQAD